MRLRLTAIRGATTVADNEAEAILAASAELVQAMLVNNGLSSADVVSGLFTLTDDLDAAFPAEGARRVGLSEAALLCARELPVPGSMPRCIRVMLHVELPVGFKVRHQYLRDAVRLRPDWTERESPASVRPVPRATTSRLIPYVPGKPIDETASEYGLDPRRIVKLASNENPLGPSPQAIRAAEAALQKAHLYPDAGSLALREALARRFDVGARHIIVGNGSDEVIKLLAEAYIQPGDDVIYAEPSFVEYAYACRLMGGREVIVPLKNGVHDLEAMLALVGERTRIVFICNPNNPTGSIVSRDALARFIEQVPAHVIVVCDEAYFEYVESSDYPDAVAWAKVGRAVLTLRTFSKAYGLAGMRVGYGIGPDWLIAQLLRVKEPFNVNLIGQAAALAALNDEEHLSRSLEVNRAGKRQLQAGLTALGMDVRPTEANFLWVDTQQPSAALYESLLRQGVIVRTGDPFGAPSFLRITIGTAEQNERLLDALRLVYKAR